MRAAHGVAVEIVSKNFGVSAHYTLGHGEAHEGIYLVTIQAKDARFNAIQEEAVDIEACFAKANPHGAHIEHGALIVESHANAVELWVLRAPKLNVAETAESEACGVEAVGGDGGGSVLMGYQGCAIEQFHMHGK